MTVWPEIVLGGLLQLLQDHRRDLRRRVLLAARPSICTYVVRPPTTWYGTIFIFVDDFVEAAAHEALDRDRSCSPGWSRPGAWRPGRRDARRLREADDRRRHAAAFRVGDDDRLAAFHDGDDGVGRAEVDADDLAHALLCFVSQSLVTHSIRT